jgi:hypothetical protein
MSVIALSSVERPRQVPRGPRSPRSSPGLGERGYLALTARLTPALARSHPPCCRDTRPTHVARSAVVAELIDVRAGLRDVPVNDALTVFLNRRLNDPAYRPDSPFDTRGAARSAVALVVLV